MQAASRDRPDQPSFPTMPSGARNGVPPRRTQGGGQSLNRHIIAADGGFSAGDARRIRNSMDDSIVETDGWLDPRHPDPAHHREGPPRGPKQDGSRFAAAPPDRHARASYMHRQSPGYGAPSGMGAPPESSTEAGYGPMRGLIGPERASSTRDARLGHAGLDDNFDRPPCDPAHHREGPPRGPMRGGYNSAPAPRDGKAHPAYLERRRAGHGPPPGLGALPLEGVPPGLGAPSVEGVPPGLGAPTRFGTPAGADGPLRASTDWPSIEMQVRLSPRPGSAGSRRPRIDAATVEGPPPRSDLPPRMQYSRDTLLAIQPKCMMRLPPGLPAQGPLGGLLLPPQHQGRHGHVSEWQLEPRGGGSTRDGHRAFNGQGFNNRGRPSKAAEPRFPAPDTNHWRNGKSHAPQLPTQERDPHLHAPPPALPQAFGREYIQAAPPIHSAAEPFRRGSRRQTAPDGQAKALRQITSLVNQITPNTMEGLSERLITRLLCGGPAIVAGFLTTFCAAAFRMPHFADMYACLVEKLKPLMPPSFIPGLQAAVDKAFQEASAALLAHAHEACSPEKIAALGSLEFPAQLCIHSLLPEEAVLKYAKSLLDEGSLEGLCKLLSTCGRALDDAPSAKDMMEGLFADIRLKRGDSSLENRMRFVLQDLLDMRGRNWAPRCEAVVPKTICEIHKEAKEEGVVTADQRKRDAAPDDADDTSCLESRLAAAEKKLAAEAEGQLAAVRQNSWEQISELHAALADKVSDAESASLRIAALERQVAALETQVGDGKDALGFARVANQQLEGRLRVTQEKLQGAMAKEQASAVTAGALQAQVLDLSERVATAESDAQSAQGRADRLEADLAARSIAAERAQSAEKVLAQQQRQVDAMAAQARPAEAQAEDARRTAASVQTSMADDLHKASAKLLKYNRKLAKTKERGEILAAQVAAGAKEVEGLRATLGASQQEVEGLRVMLGASEQEVEGLRAALGESQQEVEGLRVALGASQQEVEGLRVTLGASEQEVKSMGVMLGASEQLVSSLKLCLAFRDEALAGAQLEAKWRQEDLRDEALRLEEALASSEAALQASQHETSRLEGALSSSEAALRAAEERARVSEASLATAHERMATLKSQRDRSDAALAAAQRCTAAPPQSAVRVPRAKDAPSRPWGTLWDTTTKAGAEMAMVDAEKGGALSVWAGLIF